LYALIQKRRKRTKKYSKSFVNWGNTIL
jgi:hypothetical protein